MRRIKTEHRRMDERKIPEKRNESQKLPTSNGKILTIRSKIENGTEH